MRILAVAFLTLFAPCARSVLAQATSAPASTEDSTPAAVPARPTVTTPATLPPTGYLQFEQGFNQANGSSGLEHQFSLVQNTKLAVHPHLLVQVITQPFAQTLLPPTTRDQGDVILGGQVLLTPAPNSSQSAGTDQPSHGVHISAMAVGYQGRVRTGTSPDLDIGSFSQGLTLLADGSLPGLTFQTNFIVNQQDSSNLAGQGIRRAQLGQTLSVTRQLTPKISITGELWHFTQPTVSTTRGGAPVTRANAVGLLFTGGYVLRPNLVLDAGFERGLTSSSTGWQGFAGFTYLLPHRLWPASRH